MYFFGKLGQEPDSLTCSLYLEQFLILTQINRFTKRERERDFRANDLYHYSILLCYHTLYYQYDPLQIYHGAV